MKTMRNEGGFTLIELMIVVLIIGILVAIAIPVFSSVQANAQKRACTANLRTMDGAIQSFAAASDGVYPAALTDLAPTYIQTMPRCPLAGVYSIGGTGGGDTFAVCSLAVSDGHTYRG